MLKYNKAIVDIINQPCAHLTAEEIYQQAKTLYPDMVRATVYNNINSLCEEGKIRRIKVEGCPDRYDNMSRHDHLICIKCHKIIDIHLTDITNLLEKEVGTSFLSYDLKINTLCEDCKCKQNA